jgi:hypothetical protein
MLDHDRKQEIDLEWIMQSLEHIKKTIAAKFASHFGQQGCRDMIHMLSVSSAV